MDIVVKLPDKDYSVILTKIMLACLGCKIIELPKGHGRLIDADALRESMNGVCMGVMAGSEDYDAPLKTLDSATVVIEADKEGIDET